MEKLLARSKVVALVVCASLFILACDVGSLVSQFGGAKTLSQGQASSSSSASSQASSSQASKSSAAPVAKDAQSKISDSVSRLVDMDQKTLDSYHVEASGSDPNWNQKTQKIETETFTFKADVSGDNVHFTKVTKTDKETTTEGYIMNMKQDGGKGYSVTNGQIKEDLFMPLSWVMLPLDWGLPLIYASMGPTPRGDEAVDGRAAEKFDVDISRAPTGAAGALAGFGLNVYSSKGTAWIDKQTGALLKMNIDYERDVNDTSGGGKAVGKGSGHIEVLVTKVGKVNVTLPPVSQTGPGVASTSAPTKAGPTATATKAGARAVPTATSTPQAAAKVGEKVVAQGIAFTVTKVETVDKGASTGNTWVIVHLNVENTGSDDTYVSIDNFAFLDKAGTEYDDLTNGPSAPSTYSSKVLDYEDLSPGAKLTDRLLLRQFKKTQTSGLKLRWTGDDGDQLLWNLGL